MSDDKDNQALNDDRDDSRMRELLGGHRVEPGPGLWKGISRKLLWTELLHFNFTNLPAKFWVTGAAGLLIIAAGLYLGLNGTGSTKAVQADRPVPATLQGQHDAAAPANEPAAPAKSIASNTPAADAVDAASMGGNTPAYKTGSGARPENRETPQPVRTETFGAPGPAPSAEPVNLFVPSGGMPPAVERETGLSRLDPFAAGLFDLFPGRDTIIAISTPAGMLRVRQSPAVKSFFSAGAGVTPEFAFYSRPETYMKTNFWLNGDLTWHFSRFSLSSGIGLGYVFDEGNYDVQYKSYDSIGYYDRVVSYTVGANDEIIFNTQATAVYDSLMHFDDPRTSDRYTYLQLPLLLGYRLVETGRFSLTFRTGPAVSILVGSRKSDPVIEYPGATIIRVDNDTPSRVKTTWQLLANLYLELRMNRKISIYAEPTFRYYLNPTAEQENVTFKPPWAIGLGVGIQFNFHPKKEAQ